MWSDREACLSTRIHDDEHDGRDQLWLLGVEDLHGDGPARREAAPTASFAVHVVEFGLEGFEDEQGAAEGSHVIARPGRTATVRERVELIAVDVAIYVVVLTRPHHEIDRARLILAHFQHRNRCNIYHALQCRDEADHQEDSEHTDPEGPLLLAYV